jgi:hypothetical protein
MAVGKKPTPMAGSFEVNSQDDGTVTYVWYRIAD